MIPDIYINDVSMLSLGWIREKIDFPIPKAQTETVVIPGRNSPIRFSEALGFVSYEPRAFTISLSRLCTRKDFNAYVLVMANQYNGKLCKVKTSEEPHLYAIGTLQLSSAYDPLTAKGQLVMECTDGDSYRYHSDKTIITQSGNGTIQLENDYMPAVPTIDTTAETDLKWKIGDDSFHKTVSAGSWVIPELELRQGINSISVETEGTVTFTYQEGCL